MASGHRVAGEADNERMGHFLGTHQNRLDAKGRVSVPASFRAALRDLSEDGAGLVLLPSNRYPCIDGYSRVAYDRLGQRLAQMDVLSEEYEDTALYIYGDAYAVESDREGRIVLPEPLVAHAGLTESVMFKGLGEIFQIWEPQAGEQRSTEARSRARPGAARPGSTGGTAGMRA